MIRIAYVINYIVKNGHSSVVLNLIAQSTDVAQRSAAPTARLISNQQLQRKYYDQTIVMTRKQHNLRASYKTSKNAIAKAIQHIK